MVGRFGKGNLSQTSNFVCRDSAGSHGFAAIWGDPLVCGAWDTAWKNKGYLKNSVLIELFHILVALELWVTQFRNRRLLVSTDNKGVMFQMRQFFSLLPSADMTGLSCPEFLWTLI